MQYLKRIGCLLLLVVLFCAVLVPPVHWAIGKLVDHVPALGDRDRYTVDRVMSRMIVVVVLLSLVLRPVYFGVLPPGRVGLSPTRWRWMVLGLTGVVTVLVLLLWAVPLLAAGLWSVRPGGEVKRIAYRIGKALLSGLIVAFIEEYFFRGVVLQSLISQKGARRAVVYSSIVFSALHFMEAKGHLQVSGFDPLSGFKAIGLFFASQGEDPLRVAAKAVGLFLAGTVLSLAFLWKRHLYVSIGMHAGWVFFTKIRGDLFLKAKDISPKWVWGGNRLIDGMYWWIPILAGLVVFLVVLRKRRNLTPTRAPGHPRRDGFPFSRE